MFKKMTKVLSLVLVLAMMLSSLAVLSSCDWFKKPDDEKDDTVTYNTTTAILPSNWNELNYSDANDTQIMSYISSSFFDYDYDFGGNKYNADGSINKDAIVSGGFTTNYSAATGIEDVTSTVDAKWGYTAEQKAEGGYAWKITLRKDLKWDDGTAINADDFIYSMQAQLDPDFQNFRADTYYKTFKMINAKNYFYKGEEYLYPTIGEKGYKTNAEAVEAGADIYIDVYEFYNAKGYVDQAGNRCPQWVSIKDDTIYNSTEAWADPSNEDIQDAFSGALLWTYLLAPGASYAGYVEVDGDYESWLGIKELNTNRNVNWSDVGMYKVDDYSFVVCLGKSYQFVREDESGEKTLSYLAAYYMSSLPLVKKSLYEDCKQAPSVGETLWTTTYNTSLETTASWGPYKLTEFQLDKSYKLERNEYWYGYNMDQYKGQYSVDVISCQVVAEASANWLLFLSGQVDDASLDSEHITDYQYSKYTSYSPSTGTFGMQVYGNKTVLANSKNNNAILAIDEFRQALSYSLNRDDIVQTIWPGTSVKCLGLMNSMYYYDVENGGVYRDTPEAKEGLLRAYGFVQAEDGTWSDGASISGYTLDAAYRALTGYNPVLAKELLNKAYTTLTTDKSYNYDPSKDIIIVWGSQVDTAKQRQRMQYVQDVVDELCKGTALEGKIKFEFDASAGSKWAEAFRSGDVQVSFGAGFTGNAFNPFDIVGSFVDPDDELNYHQYWNTTAVNMTLTMPAGDYAGAGETITMDLQNWYFCLNGIAAENGAKYTYNWDAGIAPATVRLKILAALEEQAIKKAYSIMLIGEYSGSLLSPKFTQFSDDYNTMMGYGGIRYLEINYTDAEWATFVAEHNNDLTNVYKSEQ